MHEILTLQPPYKGVDEKTMLLDGKRPNINHFLPGQLKGKVIQVPKDIHEHTIWQSLCKVFTLCTQFAPDSRPSTGEILEMLDKIECGNILTISSASNPQKKGEDNSNSPQSDRGSQDKFLMKSEDIKLGRVLGQGHFGTVYACTYLPTKATYAVKKVSLVSNKNKQSIEEELNILKKVKHRNLVSLIGYSFDAHSNIDVVMDLMDYSLQMIIQMKRENCAEGNWFSVEELKKYSKQILKGLEYLHSQKIAHRDIKVIVI